MPCVCRLRLVNPPSVYRPSRVRPLCSVKALGVSYKRSCSSLHNGRDTLVYIPDSPYCILLQLRGRGTPSLDLTTRDLHHRHVLCVPDLRLSSRALFISYFTAILRGKSNICCNMPLSANKVFAVVQRRACQQPWCLFLPSSANLFAVVVELHYWYGCTTKWRALSSRCNHLASKIAILIATMRDRNTFTLLVMHHPPYTEEVFMAVRNLCHYYSANLAASSIKQGYQYGC
jgi:hypothetical protein